LARAKVRVVPKEWGEERWLVNNRLYCGKLMILRRGWRCSLHMHRVKDETFFVRTGRMLFEIEGPGGRVRKRILGPGAVQHVPPGTWHRFSGLRRTEFYEFSTTHDDADSYRKVPSGPMPRARRRRRAR
jgi:mannose-6-phosphate isomerase-like protein (cupin superfamily)